MTPWTEVNTKRCWPPYKVDNQVFSVGPWLTFYPQYYNFPSPCFSPSSATACLSVEEIYSKPSKTLSLTWRKNKVKKFLPKVAFHCNGGPNQMLGCVKSNSNGAQTSIKRSSAIAELWAEQGQGLSDWISLSLLRCEPKKVAYLRYDPIPHFFCGL